MGSSLRLFLFRGVGCRGQKLHPGDRCDTSRQHSIWSLDLAWDRHPMRSAGYIFFAVLAFLHCSDGVEIDL